MPSAAAVRSRAARGPASRAGADLARDLRGRARSVRGAARVGCVRARGAASVVTAPAPVGSASRMLGCRVGATRVLGIRDVPLLLVTEVRGGGARRRGVAQEVVEARVEVVGLARRGPRRPRSPWRSRPRAVRTPRTGPRSRLVLPASTGWALPDDARPRCARSRNGCPTSAVAAGPTGPDTIPPERGCRCWTRSRSFFVPQQRWQKNTPITRIF